MATASLSVDDLRSQVADGTVDTVLVAFTDMQGRLQGKRCQARYFLDHVVPHGIEACDYLLAVDVDMAPAAGYAVSSWELGYGDLALRPDLATLRMVPWHPATALVLCDVEGHDGTPIAVSPRQILKRQLERLAERGLVALAGTELEFIVFNGSYEEAWRRGYRGLDPVTRYNVDYSLLGSGSIEPLLRRLRNEMTTAGMVVESAKGECNLGQHEIVFRYADALTTADNHAVYKTAAKEVAAQEGMSLTFMAKYDEREGNSCHVHLSLQTTDGEPVLTGEGAHGFSPLMARFLAGQIAGLPELMLLLAPNVNSYKRYVAGSFAPTTATWGRDNRTCAFRVVGHGDSLRAECRVPGGDVNPYLALAALVAGGLHGIDDDLALEAEQVGDAYASDGPPVPTSLRDAATAFAGSKLAVAAFGQDVVDHYLHAARVELAAFEAAVTDWERFRGFERL